MKVVDNDKRTLSSKHQVNWIIIKRVTHNFRMENILLGQISQYFSKSFKAQMCFLQIGPFPLIIWKVDMRNTFVACVEGFL